VRLLFFFVRFRFKRFKRGHLVAFVVGEIKAELGLDRVELVGPRVRALLVTIAEAARCN
jgi:hypothetical protein